MPRSILITGLLAARTMAQANFATAGYKYVGCVELDLAEFPFSPAFINNFRPQLCEEACARTFKSDHVAIGGGCHCDDPTSDVAVTYTVVDEARCDTQCISNDTMSGSCGGGGFGGNPAVFNLYQKADDAEGPDDEEDCPDDEEEEESAEEPTGCPPGVIDCPFRNKPTKCSGEGCEHWLPPVKGVYPSNMTFHGCPSGGCTPPEHPPVCDGDCKSSEGHVKVIETPPCEDCETGDEHITVVTPTSCEGKHCDVVIPSACEGEGCKTGDEHTQTVTPPCKDENCEANNEQIKVVTPPCSGDDFGDKLESAKPTTTPAEDENCVDSECNQVIVSGADKTITGGVLSAVVAVVVLGYIS
ncbi:hypothetical protein QQX98_008706 [Neonectria punicea]|uniref:WSC domain-containing protein n=1 Tax=Neonectria punicea TaxID=979145 RepID=A0ABR1GUA1_9HYPO